MTNPIPSAALCPIRENGSGIEVLLTRRAFWNHLKQRPMTYPGEWVFAGGQSDPDESYLNTAIREFREELDYQGEIKDVKFLVSGQKKYSDRIFYVEFYISSIDDNPVFNLHENGEVIDYRWMIPCDALFMIHSEEFDHQQMFEINKMNLVNEIYGKYAVSKRPYPLPHADVLKIIQNKYVLPDVKNFSSSHLEN